MFLSEKVETKFVVEDLAICPGFQKEALELATYTAATIHTVTTILSRISEQQKTSPTAKITSRPKASNVLPISNARVVDLQSPVENIAQHSNVITPPGGGWSTARPLPYKSQQPLGKVLLKKQERIWTHGTGRSTDGGKTPQLKFVCLGIRSGPDETIESLKLELEKWNTLKDLKIDAVSRTYHSTMFRVQYNIAASLSTKWQETNSWPARMSVTQ